MGFFFHFFRRTPQFIVQTVDHPDIFEPQHRAAADRIGIDPVLHTVEFPVSHGGEEFRMHLIVNDRIDIGLGKKLLIVLVGRDQADPDQALEAGNKDKCKSLLHMVKLQPEQFRFPVADKVKDHHRTVRCFRSVCDHNDDQRICCGSRGIYTRQFILQISVESVTCHALIYRKDQY